MKRMNISFNNKCYKALCKLAKKADVSKGTILRNASALIDYFAELKREGYKVVLIDKDNKVKQEIIMP